MDTAKLYLPVFLPGNTRKWEEVAGVATVNEDGNIVIQLQHKEHATELVKQHNAGRFICVALDYKPKEVTDE